MSRPSVRSFVSRDRRLVARLKREHHAARFRASRGKSGIEAGRMLRDYARKVRPDWPTARDRRRDLADHVALKRLLDRAARALAAR
jgi:hypothetical protein